MYTHQTYERPRFDGPAICRFCQTAEETLQRILCQCSRLTRLRLGCIGELYSDTARNMKTTPPKLGKLIKKATLGSLDM